MENEETNSVHHVVWCIRPENLARVRELWERAIGLPLEELDLPELGLRVLIDQVYAHTSDLHEWFMQSRTSRIGEKADWYVWADAKPDGSPPSNWQSVFGGPAWTWDAATAEWYLHLFLPAQPDLNWANPAVAAIPTAHRARRAGCGLRRSRVRPPAPTEAGVASSV